MDGYTSELTRVTEIKKKWCEVDLDLMLHDDVSKCIHNMSLEEKVMLKCLAQDIIDRRTDVK